MNIKLLAAVCRRMDSPFCPSPQNLSSHSFLCLPYHLSTFTSSLNTYKQTQPNFSKTTTGFLQIYLLLSFSYIPKDTANSPISLFLFSKDIKDWENYANANAGANLHFCPAPGRQLHKLKRVLRSLPPTFTLTPPWVRRIYQIVNTSDGISQLVGDCGVCLLQSYQIIAELQEYHASTPLQSGGGATSHRA